MKRIIITLLYFCFIWLVLYGLYLLDEYENKKRNTLRLCELYYNNQMSKNRLQMNPEVKE